MRHVSGEPCNVRVLFPGTGGHVTVFSVPVGWALTEAVNARLQRAGSKVRGKVIRRGGSWVFLTTKSKKAGLRA